MVSPYFDIATVVLYIIIGMVGVICINAMMQPNPHRKAYLDKRDYSKVSFYCFIILYTFIAVFRKVSSGIGGSDAISYILNFETILQGSLLEYALNRKLESGFQLFTSTIRSVFSDYHIYFFIIYGFISFSYIKFIKEKCPNCQTYIPFILLMYPYLRAFNTIRTSMAVSFVLLALIIMDKKKWTSLALMIASVFFHRMSIIMILVWPYYYLFRNKVYKISRSKLLLVVGFTVVIVFIVTQYIQSILGVVIELDDRDIGFATRNQDNNPFERYPLVLGHLLLFATLIWYYKRIKWNDSTIYLRTIFIYDFYLIPVCVILGMWRFVEYFYPVRLALWCVILDSLMTRNRNRPKDVTIKIVSFLLFTSWLVLRIFKEWEPVKISPYIFDFGWLI